MIAEIVKCKYYDAQQNISKLIPLCGSIDGPDEASGRKMAERETNCVLSLAVQFDFYWFVIFSFHSVHSHIVAYKQTHKRSNRFRSIDNGDAEFYGNETT